MKALGHQHIERLVQLESQVHYYEPPPMGRPPFVVIRRKSPVLLSAPHGAVCYRPCGKSIWHEEDEYTAAMALLLGELCETSVIASIWQSMDSDPNFHLEHGSPYKREVRKLVEEMGIRWVLDLHGMKKDSRRVRAHQLVDLGTRNESHSLQPLLLTYLIRSIHDHLEGEDLVHENAFPAYETKRFMSVTAFCHYVLGIEAVQIEMKPQLRVPLCRINGSSYAKGDRDPSEPLMVLRMLGALSAFVEYLHSFAASGQGNPRLSEVESML